MLVDAPTAVIATERAAGETAQDAVGAVAQAIGWDWMPKVSEHPDGVWRGGDASSRYAVAVQLTSSRYAVAIQLTGDGDAEE